MIFIHRLSFDYFSTFGEILSIPDHNEFNHVKDLITFDKDNTSPPISRRLLNDTFRGVLRGAAARSMETNQIDPRPPPFVAALFAVRDRLLSKVGDRRAAGHMEERYAA